MTKAEAQRRNLSKAADFLAKTLAVPQSDIQQAAAIKAFDFCFELSWKVLKERLLEEGIEVATPRGALRAAGDAGMIGSVEEWLGYLAARNLTSHTYNQPVADQVYAVIGGGFVNAVQAILLPVDAGGGARPDPLT